MKQYLVILSGIMVVCGASQSTPILTQESELNEDGSYQWSYLSGDGSAQQQIGKVKEIPGSQPIADVQGSVSWYDPEGKLHQLSYIADENGYYPYSADIPPIPLAILRVLEWNAAHPEEERTS
ncbi:hypothetical protein GWI33_007146 [Rhynchophorus ferrugineus]|uniref:Uncharacterized protein n=1 Tax=Rhynchophorus ferrugineus TaxID=354439 RepID=A0A834MKV1_RHYFE|nr:hypothetical protein GWI33_007146 [Rhynchophorus ferrugineus]